MVFLLIRPRSRYEVAIIIAFVVAIVVVATSGSSLSAIGASLCFVALLAPRLSVVRFTKALVSLGFLAWMATAVLGVRIGTLVTLGFGTLILSGAEYSSKTSGGSGAEPPDGELKAFFPKGDGP
jgi:hypothetical protein